MFAMDGVVTLTNSSIAIAAALVVATDPRAVPVLLVPALTVFAVYRAYISERQRHEQLEFLYEANRTLSRSPEVAEAIEGAARPLARGVPHRDRRGRPVQRRRRRRCARRYGPGDQRVTMAAGRPRRSPRSSPALVDAEHPVVSLTPPFGSPAPARAPRGARHPPRDGRDAPRRGAA